MSRARMNTTLKVQSEVANILNPRCIDMYMYSKTGNHHGPGESGFNMKVATLEKLNFKVNGVYSLGTWPQ